MPQRKPPNMRNSDLIEADVGRIKSSEPGADAERTLVLFVHGLGGEATKTWGKFPGLLKDDNEFARKYQIGFFSYPTMLLRTIFNQKTPTIQELAAALRTQIENRYEKFSTIVLVCHSLGGLIGRKYLLDEFKAKRPIRVKGIMLISVPNNGADLARIGNFISWRHHQLRQMSRGSDLIELINDDWFTLDLPNVISAKYVVGTQDKVVDRFSGKATWGNADVETIAWKGHVDIVKPDSPDDEIVFILKRFLKSQVETDADDTNSGRNQFGNPQQPTQIQADATPPTLFIGREESLRDLKERLGINSARQKPAPTQALTIIRGWPGMGKTAIARVLVNDPEVRNAFAQGKILWGAIGDDRSAVLSEIVSWGPHLNSEALLQAPNLTEATNRLTGVLRKVHALLVIDDVWRAEDASPFIQAMGGDCSLVITTRVLEVAEHIAAQNPSAIYTLPPLTEENALTLLRTLAPDVVDKYAEESRVLVRDLECLPLALHVAGRLLHSEYKKGLGITQLLSELRHGTHLLAAKAPMDRIDSKTQTIPTVGVLLQKSTDYLDERTRYCFALLGLWAPKPATFSMEDMKRTWEMEDPRPTVRVLIDRGMLEPVGSERFQVHALLVAHARSLLPPGLLPPGA
jgi:pimeloyl-ACP methyl ester carboxylesterase